MILIVAANASPEMIYIDQDLLRQGGDVDNLRVVFQTEMSQGRKHHIGNRQGETNPFENPSFLGIF